MSGATPIRGMCIVGSVTVELEKSYRLMLLKIANELTNDDCQQIAFVAKLPSPTCVQEPGKPHVRLHLMNTLESQGFIGPLKLDFLEETIVAIGKRCLLDTIASYKKSAVYKEAKKRVEEQQKKKKATVKMPKFLSASDHALIQEYSAAAKELVAVKQYAKMRTLQEAYATFLTQFSQMALLMRSSIEGGDLAQTEVTFTSVARDGDAITRTLRKTLTEAGIMSATDSEHSDSSPAHSPTEETMTVFATNESETVAAPTPSTRVNSSPCQRHVVAESHEGSQSPSSSLRRKPIPLPRKKPPPDSSHASSPMPFPVPSPSPRSPVTRKFVYCQQETQHPPHSLSPTTFHIPLSASASCDCLTSSADYSGDYSGGTGDSGVGDVRQKYPLSKKSLDDLDPDKQRPSKTQESTLQGEGHEPPRYTRLNVATKTGPDGYTDLNHRAKSMEDILHWVNRQRESDS